MQADGGEGDPEEFKEFTDQELQSKVTRLRALRSRTADGGEKVGRMIYRVEKELDRRRAAGPTKDEGAPDGFKNFTDQDLRLKSKRLHALDGSTPKSGKKLRKRVCPVEEIDRRHTSGVETGHIQKVQTPSVDDPYASADGQLKPIGITSM
nr:uncharacterized protein LOC127339884 [Lolium perenne]